MNARRLHLTLGLASLLGVFAACEPPANAQDYPWRPVKIIVPYPASGLAMDMMARVIAQKLSERIGRQFYVENQPGAGGTIGSGTAANAPKDGHIILFANPDLVVQAVVKSKIPYDPFKSFTPVIEIAAAPEMIVVHPSLPVKNMQELLALLKANPGKYSYASPGYGSSPHLACEWLFKLTYAGLLSRSAAMIAPDAPPISTTCSAVDVSSTRATSAAIIVDKFDIAPVKALPSSGFSA